MQQFSAPMPQPLSRAVVSIIAILFAGLVCHAPLAAAEARYVAWLADGTKLMASSLPAWPIPGLAHRIHNHDLLAAGNPVRLVRDRRASVALRVPILTLANGDVLGARPVQLEDDEGRLGQIARVRVQLEAPLMPVAGSHLSVRTDRIARLVMRADAQFAVPPPGTVILADGRRYMARSIRWREYGLALLTAEGVVEAPFVDLIDVVFPQVDLSSAIIDDNLCAGEVSDGLICRFQMSAGSVVTSSRVAREQETSRRGGRLTSSAYYYAQAAWADQPLAIPEQEIAWCGYRAANEASLSLLPSQTLANQRLVGQPSPWQANRAPGGEILSTGGREADIGISAHAYSAIAFDLPPAAKTLELAVGFDRAAAGGGCVRCKVVADAEGGKLLWDSGVFQGSDGLKRAGPIEVSGLDRVVLVTEYADADRPAGADPLDIRDQIVWLSPLVQLDLDQIGSTKKLQTALSGAADWQIAAESARAEKNVRLSGRWNAVNSSWDTIVNVSRGSDLTLSRKHQVTPGADVMELLTGCPQDLSDHNLTLTVNGEPLEWTNNTDRTQLRQWVQRYGRPRPGDEPDDRGMTDRLAYWWDLSAWRGQEVTLELTIGGDRDQTQIAWRGLSIRSAIGDLPDGVKELPQPDILLTSLTPLETAPSSGRSQPTIDALPPAGGGGPIRFLGQPFTGGYGLARNSMVRFALKPEYRRFVAVAGCCSQMAGPLRVLIDERVVWEREAVNSLAPAEPIEIAIPSGAKSLTLQSGEGPYYGYAAFANAGFVK